MEWVARIAPSICVGRDGAFVVNTHWYVLYGGSAREDLRIGYFLWWLSFLLMALGLFDLSRSEVGKQ